MAKGEVVYLRGGPDNGVLLDYSVPPPLPAKIAYSGSLYEKSSGRKKVTGIDTYVYDYGGSTDGSGVKAPRLHKGWHDLRRSVNDRFPSALRKSHHNTQAALRALSHAQKVRR